MSQQEEIEERIAKLKEEVERLEELRDNRFMRESVYLHNNSDEYYEWEVDVDGRPRFDKDVHGRIHHMLYEVKFDVEIDTHTGEYTILQVEDGDQVLVPQE